MLSGRYLSGHISIQIIIRRQLFICGLEPRLDDVMELFMVSQTYALTNRLSHPSKVLFLFEVMIIQERLFIRIPTVLGNTYRPPALLAKMSATLDVISGGRLELGIGAGGGTGDHRASGLPFPSTAERVRMLEEAVELIKKSWTEPSATYQGQYYSLEQSVNEPKPVQKPHPPVLIGGHGETHLLRAVAGHADICNIGFEMSLEEHRSKMEIVQRHCDDLGRDPSEITITHNTRVVIAESEQEFEALAVQGAASANVTLADYKTSLSGAISGTPEQCVQQLSKYVDDGIHYFFVLFPDPIPNESLDLFAREVMSQFT
jgi:alkanesulfonate monooxygenase SsuD/methylene tetrahydromethanopterin reductase-like flavin-dependent oxidoreductase (luciferase family)